MNRNAVRLLRPGRRRRLVPYEHRRRIQRLRRRARPLVVSLAAVIVVVFGVVGFKVAHVATLDALYRAIQLFGFGGSVGDHPNTWLQIARFLGPVLVGYAAIRGVVALYREQFDLLRIRFLRDHVIVAGLGEAGFRLAAALDRDDWRVVAIESDVASPAIEGCRERGIIVVKGDATDPEVLERAGALDAELLVVTCGDDGTNVDVAGAARVRAAGPRRRVLTALVQLDDFELWHIIKAQALVDRDESRVRLEVFNILALGAELLLGAHPAFDPRRPGSPHVLVVGTAGVGPSLVLEIVREWQNADRSEDDQLRVTIASPVAEVELKRIKGRYPGIDEVPGCRLDTWNVDLAHGEIANSPADVTGVYVCLESETEALARAIALRQQPALWRAPIVIAVADEEAGVGATVRRALPAFERVRAFGVLSRTLTRDALYRHTTTEKIARLSHARHVETQLAEGASVEDDVSLLPWDDDRFPHRESNRMYADGIARKLADLGCMVVPAPLVDPRDPGFSLTDEEVERLAPAEHARWDEDMRRLGYTRGDVKDHDRKLHPMIGVPYDELPESNKAKDREHVGSMVEILARVGFRIQRVGDAEDPPARAGPSSRPTRASV